MAYVNENLQEILGGKNFTESNSRKVNDWSPNNIRTLIVGQGFILVVSHIGGFMGIRKRNLDINKEIADCDSMKQKCYFTTLFNTLSKRSLSCLEEIYFDSSLFGHDSCINDMKNYVSSLANSRIRFYGFGNFPYDSIDNISQLYEKGKAVPGFHISEHLESSVSVGNNDWYKHYFLRPQFYNMDAQNGRLAGHFRKIEKDVEKLYNDIKVEGEHANILGNISSCARLTDTNSLDRFSSIGDAMTKTDNLYKIVLDSTREALSGEHKIGGLSESLLKEAICNLENREALLKYCRLFKKIDTGTKSTDAEFFHKDSDCSLIDSELFLDRVCCNVVDKMLNKGYKSTVSMALQMNIESIPYHNLKLKYARDSKKAGSIEGYFALLGDLLGMKLSGGVYVNVCRNSRSN